MTIVLASLFRIAALLLLVWIAYAVFLYLVQDRLVFHPQPLSPGTVLLRDSGRVEELRLRSADGGQLHGWLVRGRGLKSGSVLYFGGNGEEVSHMVPEAKRFEGWNWVLINYRGYGLSEGKPGERELLADAEAIYDQIRDREGVDPENLVAMGRSLGTGVAVHLASRRKVRGAILVSPHETLVNIARERYPFIPVSLLLRHRFESATLAPGIRVPVLVLVAAEDDQIAPRHSRALAAKWGGPVTFREIPGADHNSIGDREEYWGAIGEFLEKLVKSDPGPDSANSHHSQGP